MSDTEQVNQEKSQENIIKKPLPISIKIIGWLSIIVSALISVLIIVSIIIISILGGFGRIEEVLHGLEYPFLKGLPFSGIGTIILTLLYMSLIGITGIFLLRKNLYAWATMLIFTSAGWLFSFIESISANSISNGISMIVGTIYIWKLYEHRNLFLRKNNA